MVLYQNTDGVYNFTESKNISIDEICTSYVRLGLEEILEEYLHSSC